MNITVLTNMVNARLQETLVAMTVIGWMDEAQNILCARMGARFPSFINPDGTQSTITEPVWDRRFHDMLVVYACARFRESDEAFNEAQYLDDLFRSRMNDAIVEMTVDVPYKDDDDSQQFIATALQTNFIITKETFYPTYGLIRVFVNSVEKSLYKDFTIKNNTVTLITPSIANDMVSVIWETPHAYNFPPQQFQGSW